MNLSTEQLKALEDFAYNLIPINLMAIMMEVDAIDLRQDIEKSDTDAHRAYYKGYGRMLLETRQSIIRSAHNGSNPAQMALLGFLRQFQADNTSMI
ncbi:MAG: hypothetical protein IJ762_04205 [Bacteroidaceae bacterium]|nr:hypothetical protein [Bacteroidaceae bacterium]MBR1788380.1 hypothetical protein [Bacteroidaceae bacterium]